MPFISKFNHALVTDGVEKSVSRESRPGREIHPRPDHIQIGKGRPVVLETEFRFSAIEVNFGEPEFNPSLLAGILNDILLGLVHQFPQIVAGDRTALGVVVGPIIHVPAVFSGGSDVHDGTFPCRSVIENGGMESGFEPIIGRRLSSLLMPGTPVDNRSVGRFVGFDHL